MINKSTLEGDFKSLHPDPQLGVLELWAQQNLGNLLWALPTVFFFLRAHYFSVGDLSLAPTPRPQFFL